METTAEHKLEEPARQNQLDRLQAWLLWPTDVATLAVFRILFGALMVWEVTRYFEYDRIFRYYVIPDFYFTYELFPMIHPWPEPWIYVHFIAMGVFAAGVMLGLFYRAAAFLFFISYSYVFLLDKAQHNNHYYLIILFAFLLTCVDAHRWLSVDKWWHDRQVGESTSEFVPFWQLFIFRAQIVIVYFYAGVAKLNADWLIGEPMRAWLNNRADYPLLGPFFQTEAAVYFFSGGGLLFDLSIGFLLLWRRTRPFAILAALFFHLMNKWLFSIGVFPYMMIATIILFLEPDWSRRLLRLAKPIFPTPTPTIGPSPRGTWVVSFVAIYLAIQILAPLRHWLYPGEVSWTEEAHRFSWHMKLRDKDAVVTFYITDPETNQTWEVDIGDRITDRQYSKMASRPDMIIQFAHHIHDQFDQAGIIEDPIVQAEAWASLNGRDYQPLVDPTVDLAKEDLTVFGHFTWIVPLQAERSEALTEK